MLEFLTHHRWNFLILAEAVFWISLLIAITMRYWFDKPKAALAAIMLTLINELWILFLAILDLKQTGQLSVFQIVIVILIVYTLVLGKRDLKKVDRFIHRKVARFKGREVPEHLQEVKYGMAKAKEELKGFGLHVLLFLSVHAVFYLLLYFVNRELHPVPPGAWVPWLKEQFHQHQTLVQVNKIWSVLLVLDAVISFSYLLFPKKES
ncbi:hypothetical protein [Paenibacillus puerhi]|uniref:hypothetical protein n=1 Tax=Paenibacillus puerhi TaxID=2692622 RepID=UPI00135B54D5|nr:hypothetical protein [Paenibacillus puerhi]